MILFEGRVFEDSIVEESVDLGAEDFYILCVDAVGEPWVKKTVWSWVSAKKINKKRSSTQVTFFKLRIRTFNKFQIFLIKFYSYPDLIKSPNNCLNFLHNFSSVCDNLLRLICLKRLGPNKNGKSALCCAPKNNLNNFSKQLQTTWFKQTAKIINGASHVHRVWMMKHIDI